MTDSDKIFLDLVVNFPAGVFMGEGVDEKSEASVCAWESMYV